jgi:hypothetical protein
MNSADNLGLVIRADTIGDGDKAAMQLAPKGDALGIVAGSPTEPNNRALSRPAGRNMAPQCEINTAGPVFFAISSSIFSEHWCFAEAGEVVV